MRRFMVRNPFVIDLASRLIQLAAIGAVIPVADGARRLRRA
jgi:hypothetical protein